jgi:hypothetical protein
MGISHTSHLLREVDVHVHVDVAEENGDEKGIRYAKAFGQVLKAPITRVRDSERP